MHIVASAPVRICDLGGWTDTWFAGHGAVCHIAVWPGVRADVRDRARGAGEPCAMVDARSVGTRFAVHDGPPFSSPHPVIAAALQEAAVPAGVALDITISAGMPAGASTGTSASVVVALLAACDRLFGRAIDPRELARRAHRVEVERLGQQSGVQDQIAAAYGGINFVEIDAYPEARVTRLHPDEATRTALDARLLLIDLGHAHRSSQVHEEVIASIRSDPGRRAVLDRLRQAAVDGRRALGAGDLSGYARALEDNTRAQAALHPGLISAEARLAGETATRHGAAAWKVNGAGGEGGSVSILLGPDIASRGAIVAALAARLPAARPIDVRLSAEGVTAQTAEASRASGAGDIG